MCSVPPAGTSGMEESRIWELKWPPSHTSHGAESEIAGICAYLKRETWQLVLIFPATSLCFPWSDPSSSLPLWQAVSHISVTAYLNLLLFVLFCSFLTSCVACMKIENYC